MVARGCVATTGRSRADADLEAVPGQREREAAARRSGGGFRPCCGGWTWPGGACGLNSRRVHAQRVAQLAVGVVQLAGVRATNSRGALLVARAGDQQTSARPATRRSAAGTSQLGATASNSAAGTRRPRGGSGRDPTPVQSRSPRRWRRRRCRRRQQLRPTPRRCLRSLSAPAGSPWSPSSATAASASASWVPRRGSVHKTAACVPPRRSYPAGVPARPAVIGGRCPKLRLTTSNRRAGLPRASPARRAAAAPQRRQPCHSTNPATDREPASTPAQHAVSADTQRGAHPVRPRRSARCCRSCTLSVSIPRRTLRGDAGNLGQVAAPAPGSRSLPAAQSARSPVCSRRPQATSTGLERSCSSAAPRRPRAPVHRSAGRVPDHPRDPAEPVVAACGDSAPCIVHATTPCYRLFALLPTTCP